MLCLTHSVACLAINSLTVDSIKIDSLQIELTHLDSLRNQFNQEHGIALDEFGLPKYRQWNDSIAHIEDSIKAARKNPIEDPILYTAKDSMVFYMDTKNAYLFGDGKVNYQDLELVSEKIALNLDSSLVHASGVEDSVGVFKGTPIFKQGGDTYETLSMDYNFKTKKGYISNVYTAQAEGYLNAEESKRDSEGTLFLKHGRYTTCDRKHPHFYIALSRAKAHPGKDVFSGPAWLVVEDVPLPLAIPFAYFPFTKSYSSGFIMPSYGDEFTRGFYLRDGGYYFAINDNMDLKLTGEIYTKGSWGLGGQSTYAKRYKYAGNIYVNYQVTKESEKNLPDYSEAKNFKIQWTHKQDAKLHPNSSFSASVNFATQNYERNNITSWYNPTSYSQSTRTSSVSYSHNFSKIGLSLSSSFNIAQNMRDSTLSMTLPSLSISLGRFYPLKRKHIVGKERWYEKIAMSYTGTLSNSYTGKEGDIMKSNIIKDWNNGMRHSIPISASFNLFKYINITPSFNYTERWYTNKINQEAVYNATGASYTIERDTIYGFNRVYNYNMSVSANTRVYGFFTPNRKIFGNKLQKIRHVFTPTVSFSYAPDFGNARYGSWKTLKDKNGNEVYDATGNPVKYSPYSGMLYGTTSQGKTGSISVDIANNIEAKILSDKDTTGVRKISIIDELGASMSYNMAAQRQPWSDLSTRLRLKWGKIQINLNGVFKTYAYETNDPTGKTGVITSDYTEYSWGRFGRFQGLSKSVSYSFNNQSFKKLKAWWNKIFRGIEEEEKQDERKDTQDKEDNEIDDSQLSNREKMGSVGKEVETDNTLDGDGYMKLTIPWSFNISYGITMAEDRTKGAIVGDWKERTINGKTEKYYHVRYPYSFTQTLNFSGSISLSSSWHISFSSGWDFTNEKISMTSININRDMHCFNISGGVVLGPFSSYHVTLRANASTLTDALKYDKRSSYSSAIKWY